ncbi:MAG TPA: PIG-L family deacetylase, partial [Bacteroidia bacterium]
IVLGCTVSQLNDTAKTKFTQLKDYTESKIKKDGPVLQLDRTSKFGYKKALNYKIVVNWEIAEHKSQGTMQMGMSMGDIENFWYFDLNGEKGIEKCKTLFEALKEVPYKTKTY